MNNFSEEFDQRQKVKNISQTDHSTSESSHLGHKALSKDPLTVQAIENVLKDQVNLQDISILFGNWLTKQDWNPINKLNVSNAYSSLVKNIKIIVAREAQNALNICNEVEITKKVPAQKPQAIQMTIPDTPLE